MSPEGRRALRVCAAANVVLHAAGLALAATVLRPGSPLVSLDERVRYLAEHRLAWSLGWAAWMLCALLLVWFLALVAAHAASPAAAAAVALAAAGAGVDLFCEAIQIAVLPALAARPDDRAVFLAFERAAGAGGLVAANGLYSIAVLAVAASLRRRLTPAALGLGVATFLAGMLLAGAGLADSPLLLPAATGATVVAFLAWVGVVTRGLLRRA